VHVWFGQQRANLLKHAPRAFVGNPALPLNLFRADPAAGRPHEVHCVEPLLERSAGLLEDGSGHRRDHAATVVAGIGRTPGNPMVLALFLALGAMGDPARKSLLFQVFKAGLIVWELLEESL